MDPEDFKILQDGFVWYVNNISELGPLYHAKLKSGNATQFEYELVSEKLHQDYIAYLEETCDLVIAANIVDTVKQTYRYDANMKEADFQEGIAMLKLTIGANGT
jgi:hypothetical protein